MVLQSVEAALLPAESAGVFQAARLFDTKHSCIFFLWGHRLFGGGCPLAAARKDARHGVDAMSQKLQWDYLHLQTRRQLFLMAGMGEVHVERYQWKDFSTATKEMLSAVLCQRTNGRLGLEEQ